MLTRASVLPRYNINVITNQNTNYFWFYDTIFQSALSSLGFVFKLPSLFDFMEQVYLGKKGVACQLPSSTSFPSEAINLSPFLLAFTFVFVV